MMLDLVMVVVAIVAAKATTASGMSLRRELIKLFGTKRHSFRQRSHQEMTRP
jgi:uncharacterized protein (DUF697 family)